LKIQCRALGTGLWPEAILELTQQQQQQQLWRSSCGSIRGSALSTSQSGLRRPRGRSLIAEFVKAFEKTENLMSSLESP